MDEWKWFGSLIIYILSFIRSPTRLSSQIKEGLLFLFTSYGLEIQCPSPHRTKSYASNVILDHKFIIC